jgi:hypothetical protein
MMKDFGWLFAIIPSRDFSLLNVREQNQTIEERENGAR